MRTLGSVVAALEAKVGNFDLPWRMRAAHASTLAHSARQTRAGARRAPCTAVGSRPARRTTSSSWRLTALVLGVALATGAAHADWIPGKGYDWLQAPEPDGWDVHDDLIIVLADDFASAEPGWVTGIHFWGGWRGDAMGAIEKISLGLHANVPAGQDPAKPFAHPGEMLWHRSIETATYGGVVMQPWGTGGHGWYDPSTGSAPIAADHIETWQVNVTLNPSDWFLRSGSASEPTVYWLSLGVYPSTYEDFGWRTSSSHWNASAVQGLWFGPQHGSPLWAQDLGTPPFGREGLDMAFVLTGAPVPEPATAVLFALGLGALGMCRHR